MANAATTYYVSPTGTNTFFPPCGLSPANACKTIAHVVGFISGTDKIIKVTQGEYRESVQIPDTNSKITIQGGWNADFNQQSCDSSGTVISPGATHAPPIELDATPGTIVDLNLQCLSFKGRAPEDHNGISL
jgi:hypothetical protein